MEGHDESAGAMSGVRDSDAVPHQALAGVRVLDFSWSVAGPTITRYLAALGAEVIKVEWPARPDMMRLTMFADDIEPTLDSACFFATVNPGKFGLSLDLKSAEGREHIESLVRMSDLVVESFSASVMQRLNLDYESLTRLKPDVIYLSMSGFGHSGRYRDYDTWGPTAQAFNGLVATSGLPGCEPAGWGFSYMDVMAGYHGAVAALMALYHQRATGEGQCVDIAQVETGLALTGPTLLEASVDGGSTDRMGVPPGNRAVWPGSVVHGQRGEVGAPYNCYATNGGGRFDYCAITILNDDQWQSLKKVMGDPAWASAPEFDTLESRLANQDRLDELVGEWASTFEKFELMRLLQDSSIPSGALQSFEEIVEADPQLAHRKVMVKGVHPRLGSRRWETIPMQLSETPPVFDAHWPLLGADNETILGSLLGLPHEEIEVLDAKNVTWPKDLPKDIPVHWSLW
jgi:crotonobetainyl-CoA:carnitine CoA-transferase CaiB-like acyl-CoA transferase